VFLSILKRERERFPLFIGVIKFTAQKHDLALSVVDCPDVRLLKKRRLLKKLKVISLWVKNI
jgi:hypothetical protein